MCRQAPKNQLNCKPLGTPTDRSVARQKLKTSLRMKEVKDAIHRMCGIIRFHNTAVPSRGCQKNAITPLDRPHFGQSSGHELLTSHPAHALHVIGRLLEGVRRWCADRGAVRRMPLLVLLLALGPVCFASSICGEVPARGIVNIVVLRTPLHKDVLTPRAELPVATLVGARGEDSMAVLQVCRQNRGRGAAHHLQIAEESVLHIRAILEVNAVRGVAALAAEPLAQALWHEDSNCNRLDHVIALLPFADLADLHPDQVEHTPIHPYSCFTLDLVELSECVLHLNRAVGGVDSSSHVGEHVPGLACEDADAILLLSLIW